MLAGAAAGASASLNLDPVRDALRLPPGFPAMWKTVVHLENHDIVDADRQDASQIQPRIAALACTIDRRCWYARSRSRVASVLLLTAPGIPMLFMGQEFMEDKPWHNNPARSDLFIYWDGLKADANMRDFRRFMEELCWLRRSHPALRAEGCNSFYVHNQNRVIAVQRWIEGVGRDVVVVASFNETTHFGYRIPFPIGGRWFEVFNSEAYDSMPAEGGYNTNVTGNPNGIVSDGPPCGDQPYSAIIDIPANGALVFARDRGDPTSRPT